MILSDITIRQLCTGPEYEGILSEAIDEMTARVVRKIPHGRPMIEPFVSESIKNDERGRIASFGLSSYGYDVRLAKKFKIFTNINNSLIDPLDMPEDCYHEQEGDSVILPPNSYLLGHTVETFDIPRNVSVVCLGKSTWARAGVIVNVTPIEAGFKGQVVIEISNATNLPIKIHAGMGIAQFQFFLGDRPCEVSYDDRGGKYQGQSGIQLAKV
tara:strand:- start:78491 stop:79129 length:639 start_codon:yes stop_codon:yes gene_type:complete